MSEQSKQSALDRLEKWCRKHYRFTISCGGFVQPGDEVWVQLKGGNREVHVDYWEPEFEMVNEDGEPEPPNATIGELINLALDRWESCDTPKQFDCNCHDFPNDLVPTIETIPGYVRTIYSNQRDDKSRYWIRVNGTKESLMRIQLEEMFPGTSWDIREAYVTPPTTPESRPQPDATSP